MAEDIAPRQNFLAQYRKPVLGGLAVVAFFAAWQAIFLIVPFDPLFISKPNLIAEGYVDLFESGDLFHDLGDISVKGREGHVRAYSVDWERIVQRTPAATSSS